METCIVAIDALYFGIFPELRLHQYKYENLEREINKAYIGFNIPEEDAPINFGIATG